MEAPIALFYRAALSGRVSFSPDWDPALPVDAFVVKGAYDAITITTDAGEYRVARNADGALSAFPFFYGGAVFAVQTISSNENILSGLTITARERQDGAAEADAKADGEAEADGEAAVDGEADGGETAIDIEFLEYEASPSPLLGDAPAPRIARVRHNEAYAFASFAYSNDEIIEAHFAEDGTALFLYCIRFSGDGQGACVAVERRSAEGSATTEMFYDGMGNVTGIALPDGASGALYNSNGVRYWTRRFKEGGGENKEAGAEKPEETTQEIEIQYDERGLPVRQTMRGADGSRYVDHHYTFDEWGNWIERRDAYKEVVLGVLIAVDEKTIRRDIAENYGR